MGLFAGISPKIIVDAYPTHFVFSRPDKDFRVSLGTFLHMLIDEKHGFVMPFSIGEGISEETKRADRFSGTFQNPRKMFERILRSAGAGSIVFDQTDL